MSTDREIASEFGTSETAKAKRLVRLSRERLDKRKRERDEAFVYVTPRARSSSGRYHYYVLGAVNLALIRPAIENSLLPTKPMIEEIWRNRRGQLLPSLQRPKFSRREILIDGWHILQVNWHYGQMLTAILSEKGRATMQMQRKWTHKEGGRGASRGEYQCYVIAGVLSNNGQNNIPAPLVASLSTGADH